MAISSIAIISQPFLKPIIRSIIRRDDDDDDVDYDNMSPEVRNAYAAYYRHIAYTKQTVYFSSCLIFFALLVHLVFSIRNFVILRRQQKRLATAPTGVEAQVAPGGRHTSTGISIRRIPSATLNLLRIVGCRYNIQVDPFDWSARFTLIEIAIPVAYWIALLTWTFVNCTSLVDGRPLDLIYWANRSGTIATGQLCFVVALAGKNNIITFLTGISYEKLNILHRAISRTLLVLIWVHTAGWCKYGLTDGIALSNGWMAAGLVATIALTFLVFLGDRRLRQMNYELFLIGHIILGFVFLMGTYWHLKVYFPEYINYAWPTFLIWALDRAMRGCRAVFAKYQAKNSVTKEALVEILSADTLRVTQTYSAKSWMRWNPGQNVYLTVPVVSKKCPLEAHPFTVASIDSPVDNDSASPGAERQMKLIIRAREGFTGRLYEYAAKNGGASHGCRVSAWIDGPYGPSSSCHVFPNVAFVAGGSGVAYTLPLLLDLVRRARIDAAVTTRVLFVWAIRRRKHIGWISEDVASLMQAKPSSLDIEFHLFVTGEHHSVPTLDKQHDDASSGSGSSPSASKEEFDSPIFALEGHGVSVSSGRPDLNNILSEWVLTCGDSVSVNVSGPTSLIKDVRSTFCTDVASPSAILRGGPSIQLNVETFSI